MARNKVFAACRLAPLLLPCSVSALVVDIQGVRLEPEMAGASCIDIAGDYPGLRIESDRPGFSPRICHNAARVNSISIANTTLVSTGPSRQEIVIRFEHDFPPGINGRIMARAKLQGFFATGSGVGAPAGDKLALDAFFSQGGVDDPIDKSLDFTVGDQIESAIFDYSVKKQYLTAGPRSLKGAIRVVFSGSGHKLTLADKALVSLDTGGTFEDKLESLEVAEEAAVPEAVAGGAKPEISPLPPAEELPALPEGFTGPAAP
jgi:hypothetical protein